MPTPPPANAPAATPAGACAVCAASAAPAFEAPDGLDGRGPSPTDPTASPSPPDWVNDPIPLLEPLLPDAPPPATAQPLVQTVDVRSLSLGVLAVLGTLAFLYWARAVFVPITLGVLLAYAMAPVVDRLEAWRLPRWAGATGLMAFMFVLVGAVGWSLSDEAEQFIDELPAVAQKIRTQVKSAGHAPAAASAQGFKPLDRVQEAAQQLQQVAQEQAPAQGTGLGAAGQRGKPVRVVVEPAPFDIKTYVISGTVGLATAVGQAAMVFFLTLFILSSGRTFRLKMVRLAGPRLGQKRLTVEMLDEIGVQIQRYLLVQIITSAMVGVGIGLAFWALGLSYAPIWALVAAVLHLLPYVGGLVVTALGGAVALVQSGSPGTALAVVGASIAIHTVIGQLLTPWLTSKTSQLNPVAVFVSMLFWGWLWGIWGLLLGVPVMMVVKSVCDRVEGLGPVGELLSN